MTETMQRHLAKDIAVFECSVGEVSDRTEALKTSDRIISLIKENPAYSAKSISGLIGISAKGVEKQLAKLKSQGVIRHVGPAKGGRWEIISDN